MRLVNKSSYNTDELKYLARKVVRYFKYQKEATVEVRDEAEWGGIGHGVYRGSDNSIGVWLPRGTMYPFRDMYRKRAGDKLVQCWQDLFVAILAHELRHCDQRFMERLEGARFPHPEVDAEKYAFKVFDKYREEIDGPSLSRLPF